MHVVAGLTLTLVMSAALLGLGAVLGGRSAGDRWVRGWTAVWWLVALVAELAGPRPGAWAGFALLGGGLWAAVALARERPRAVLLLGGALMAGAPLWLLPPYFYDTLVYHLGLPWTWLANDSFATAPHNLFSHFPLSAPAVFLLPVAVGLPEVAAGLHWATFVITLVAVAGLAERLGAGPRRWLAPALLLGCWHATWIATVAAPDHLVVLGVVVMADHLVAGDETRRERALGVGLAFGFAVAAKYTAAVPVAAILAVGTLLSPSVTGPSAALGVTVSSFWWVRNLVTTGNPVFPLLWSLLGGTGWSPADNQRFLALVREGVGSLAGVPVGLARLVVPGGGLGWWVVAALPLVALAIFDGRGARVERRAVALAAFLSLGGWLVTSQTIRYALPFAALAAALAAAGAGRLGTRSGRMVVGLLGITVGLGVLNLSAFVFGVLGVGQVWRGAESAGAWRHAATVNDPLPAYDRCDTVLPRKARILVVGEGRPWGCPRPHHVSSPYDEQLVQEVVETSPTAAAAVRRMQVEGFTHILVNWAEVTRLGGPDYRVLRWSTPAAAQRWREVVETYTTPVFREGAVDVRAFNPDLHGLTPAARWLAH